MLGRQAPPRSYMEQKLVSPSLLTQDRPYLTRYLHVENSSVTLGMDLGNGTTNAARIWGPVTTQLLYSIL